LIKNNNINNLNAENYLTISYNAGKRFIECPQTCFIAVERNQEFGENNEEKKEVDENCHICTGSHNR